MRFSTGAAAASLSLFAAGGFAAAAAGTAAPVEASATSTPTAGKPEAGMLAGDAAAKHANRAACLKSAKAKKLVNTEKTSFLKACIAAS